jgi:hypothetical protein
VGEDGAVKVVVGVFAAVLFAFMASSLAVREADFDLSVAAAAAPRSGLAISALRAALAKALVAALKTSAMTLVEMRDGDVCLDGIQKGGFGGV